MTKLLKPGLLLLDQPQRPPEERYTGFILGVAANTSTMLILAGTTEIQIYTFAHNPKEEVSACQILT